jgi:DNA-binding XRE family transcriptional regulator
MLDASQCYFKGVALKASTGYALVVPAAKSPRQILAQNLRKERTRLGLSQEKLAERAGLHRTYVGGVERAERNVSIDNIQRLAAAVGRSMAEILSE